jgi:hypothetical protein
LQVIIGTGFEVTLDMIKTLNISYVVSQSLLPVPSTAARHVPSSKICSRSDVLKADRALQVHGTHYDAPQTPDPYKVPKELGIFKTVASPMDLSVRRRRRLHPLLSSW